MQVMVWSVYPLATLSRWMTRVITHRAPGQQPTEDEILIMADMAAQGGAILPDELRWVENVLHLNNITVNQLMTPRQVVFSLPASLRLDSAEFQREQLVHSRIPVTEDGDLNRVIGVVQRRVVLDHLIRIDCDKTIRELMRPTLFVPETWGGHQLLDRLMAERQHLAVVSVSNRRREWFWNTSRTGWAAISWTRFSASACCHGLPYPQQHPCVIRCCRYAYMVWICTIGFEPERTACGRLEDRADP